MLVGAVLVEAVLQPPPVVSRRTLIGRELLVNLAEEEQADVDGLDLLGFWLQKGTASICPTTGKILAPADMPYLTVIARLFHAIDGIVS